MTDSNIIENKDLVDKMVDLMSKVIKIDRKAVTIERYVLIDDIHEMSIDVLANGAYGRSEAIDILCKFNGISNPLSIKKGDIIAIPNLASLMSNTKRLEFKGIQLQKRNNLLTSSVTNVDNFTKSPSKKSVKKKNFTKSKDGILIF